MWLLMSTIDSRFDKIEYWSNKLPSAKNRALYRFNEWISRYHFRDIMHAMQYTDEEPLLHRDKFHKVRKLITTWNDNIAHMFWLESFTCLSKV